MTDADNTIRILRQQLTVIDLERTFLRERVKQLRIANRNLMDAVRAALVAGEKADKEGE